MPVSRPISRTRRRRISPAITAGLGAAPERRGTNRDAHARESVSMHTSLVRSLPLATRSHDQGAAAELPAGRRRPDRAVPASPRAAQIRVSVGTQVPECVTAHSVRNNTRQRRAPPAHRPPTTPAPARRRQILQLRANRAPRADHTFAAVGNPPLALHRRTSKGQPPRRHTDSHPQPAVDNLPARHVRQPGGRTNGARLTDLRWRVAAASAAAPACCAGRRSSSETFLRASGGVHGQNSGKIGTE